MALTSPGVSVSVSDESFYTPAEPGTTPLIFVATKENKQNPGATGTASGTLASNAGKPYLISSQRELSETFGDPLFYKDASNNMLHGSEQNEYGLQAAYSFLGVANRAYVVRANLDLADISASATATAGKAANASYWFDTDDTKFGIFEWNGAAGTVTGGQSFTNKVPTVITDTTKVVDYSGADYTPKGSVGAIGDYAVVAVTNINRMWYKNSAGAWVEVGSAAWKASHPMVTGTVSTPTIVAGETLSFNISLVDSGGTQISQVTSGTTLTSIVSDINGNSTLQNAGITAKAISNRLAIYYNGSTTQGGVAVDRVEIYGDVTLTTALGIPQADYYSPELNIAPHTNVPEFKAINPNPRPTGSIWVKTTNPNKGANWSVKQYNSTSDVWTTINAPIYNTNYAAIYSLDSTGGGANISEGALYIQNNLTEIAEKLATFKVYRKNSSGATTITSGKVLASTFSAGTYTFTVSESKTGIATMSAPVTVSFTATGATSDAELIANAINSAGFTNITATIDSVNRITVSHALGGDIRFVDTAGALASLFTVYDSTNPSSTTNFYFVPGTNTSTSPKQFMASLWKVLTYTAKATEPTTIPATGTLWYSSIVDEVDLLIHNGTTWVGLHNFDPLGGSATGANSVLDPAGPIVSASQPTTQSDKSALVEGDIWISTADLENYPTMYRWNASSTKWVLLDKTDQTTENGILFDDVRYNTSGENSATAGTIVDLLTSNYLDPDSPDPALYPKGMIIWNTRRSGFNVKRYVQNHIDTDALNTRMANASMSGYYANRWVTESANNQDGSGSFGRHAQRKVVVSKLQASVNDNDDIRDNESKLFNLIACPGYPELIGEMKTLNYDRGLTAFVIGDAPMRLRPTATNINNWVTNTALAPEDNDDGLVTNDEYLGVYYPAGFTSDNAGNNIVVPASHMVLRTIALNDQVAYPWFAPAGTRRGGVTNATATGYISAEGEFISSPLNAGQRDTLYSNNVNPITFLQGSGIVIFGQKTRAKNASSLDRVNVARLVIYLRSQLNALAKPYLFEPNDKITRDEIKQQVEGLLVELIGLRAIYDYLVVCDTTNNTSTRIDRNELYVDIAIEPVKAVEFIYIPLRLKNTGEIAGL
jgi:hypothetical protein